MDPTTDDYAALPLTLGAGALYLTGEDNLKITTFGALAGAVLAIEGRIVTPEGCLTPIAERHVPNSNRTAATSFIPLREGWLTNLQLRETAGGAIRGCIFVLVEIIRGTAAQGQTLGTLLSDYVTTNNRLTWPGSRILASVSDVGRIRTIVGTNPAAGVEISETVPAAARWKLRTFGFTLVTSAVVANRTPVLTIDDGANIIWETGNNVAQTATQTAKYRAGIGVPLTTIGALTYQLPLPSDLPLLAGYRIRTVTGLIDVGDDYAAPIYEVEEWIEP